MLHTYLLSDIRYISLIAKTETEREILYFSTMDERIGHIFLQNELTMSAIVSKNVRHDAPRIIPRYPPTSARKEEPS